VICIWQIFLKDTQKAWTVKENFNELEFVNIPNIAFVVIATKIKRQLEAVRKYF
jgi:hypothetical protein